MQTLFIKIETIRKIPIRKSLFIILDLSFEVIYFLIIFLMHNIYWLIFVINFG